ncbi:methyltransferase family protein [Nocardia tenerifensis]|uniref:Methyltransferase family protein n=1 Tax=Nocardia tenerifensis TaxID=228006 RepID=A0A318K167_9NOCA|nr:class I SAM-dependent methyltransferase [Nocardia tenerifensis]PXX60905.1 methyltransferase family protein [Nocardia tenerifensis]
MTDSRDADATRLATESLAQDDPTGWFERLYVEAADGTAVVPWDAPEPNALLVDWLERHARAGGGTRAMVVGCGLGRDAEHLAELGFETTAFDVAETAIKTARERFPDSPVDYVVGDLLDPPAEWNGAFDLVVESITVQSLPVTVRDVATANVARMVAPGGDLLVIAGIAEEGAKADGPPWPLTRAEIDAFATGDLRPVEVEQASPAGKPNFVRWRAVFHRG